MATRWRFEAGEFGRRRFLAAERPDDSRHRRPRPHDSARRKRGGQGHLGVQGRQRVRREHRVLGRPWPGPERRGHSPRRRQTDRSQLPVRGQRDGLAHVEQRAGGVDRREFGIPRQRGGRGRIVAATRSAIRSTWARSPASRCAKAMCTAARSGIWSSRGRARITSSTTGSPTEIQAGRVTNWSFRTAESPTCWATSSSRAR